jgi:hypothetical protein
MGVEQENRNEILSRIVGELFVKSKGGEDLSSKIHRLRDEIDKVIEGNDTIFGKFRELVESFREIIPDEKQRYNAAIKALSTTSKLSRQEIVKAINNQLAELKILEKGLLPALPGWREELRAMEAKSREMRADIAKLRERIGRLESEEKGIVNDMAGREKEMELVETAVGELFEDITEEITYIKKKVEEFTAESADSQPIPPRDSIKSSISSEENGGGEQKSEISESSAAQVTEWQKKCPMCGGQMNFQLQDETWMCYVCAYEESEKDKVQGKSEEKSEATNAPEPTPASAPLADPWASSSTDRYRESKKAPTPAFSQPSSKKKPCPVCHKKMSWYPIEKAWRCPFCQYERSI